MLNKCEVGDLVQVSSVRDIIFVVDECSDRYQACIYTPTDSKKEVLMRYSELCKITPEQAHSYIEQRKKELDFNLVPEQLKNSKLATLNASLKELNKLK